MMVKRFWANKSVLFGASIIAICFASHTPSYAQEGAFMRQFLGQIGLIPEDKDPIDYKERPSLVVPKDTTKLRPPEEAGAHTKSAQWPVDPDMVERKRAEERRRALMVFPSQRDSTEGAKLSPTELAAGRSAKGQKATDGTGSRVHNRDDGSIPLEEMMAKNPVEQRQRLAAGVEPPREFLTDPPKGLRLPDTSAPIKRTQESPIDLEDKAFRRPMDQ